jgi:hypothetical protein
MIKALLFTFVIAGACLADSPAATAGDVNPEEIIKKFAQKESSFLKARESYTYKQTVKLVELDADGNPNGGKYEIVEDVIFDRDGKRMEKVLRAPPNTLKNILLTPEDEQDLRNVQPFVLNAENIDKYIINYMGKQQVDEINCYLFAVRPKQMVKGERYFDGQIWVDDRDLQIVKTYGKGVGRQGRGGDNQFPKFETYREQIDGKYWFPTYTIANDTLHFKDSTQRIKMTVKYEDYKQFKSDVTIQYGEEVKDNGKPEDKKPEDPKPVP